MKTLFILLFLAMAAFGESPAESSIRKAQEQITTNPKNVSAYSSLAMAYARRARETSDVAFYAKAEETLDQANTIAADHFEIEKVRVWLMLGRHEFARALEAATRLKDRAPDDITVWGYLADANAELGNYKAAVDAAQWMLRLRAGNIPGLTRAAYLRELHGDISGAIDLMQRAYDATAYSQFEDRAWILTQIAHLHLISGERDEAAKFAQAALDMFPGYHYALGTLAQVRLEQQRYPEAIDLLQQRYQEAPHAENLFSLAEALDAAGQHDAAQTAYAKFEKDALAESTSTDNANHELMRYYTDVAHQPEKAIAIAQAELTRRHDIHTLDAYAWALLSAGRRSEAKEPMQQALATGSRDPLLLRHAAALQ